MKVKIALAMALHTGTASTLAVLEISIFPQLSSSIQLTSVTWRPLPDSPLNPYTQPITYLGGQAGAVLAPKPPSMGIPDGRKPAGSRGECENSAMPLTPLLPVTDSGFSGLTLKEHPIFWFYVPYKTNSVISGKFSLKDGEENIFYQTNFKLPKTPGFVSVSIPPQKTLEVNQQYEWQFKIYCLSKSSSQRGFVFHEGLVQRVALPAVENQLKTATSRERIAQNIANQIWYDVPRDLAEIRRYPEDWDRVLRAIGLKQLEDEQIAGEVMPDREKNIQKPAFFKKPGF